jgi:enoyl-[acyl-carrier protein] reductase I
MAFLADKRILIVGVASERSIAWGIAKAMHREGAELAFTYQNDKLADRVRKLAAEVDSDLLVPLDVADDTQIDAAFSILGERWGRLDGIVHAVAFAPREQLAGNFVDSVDREGFRIAHDISSYSFAALARAGHDLMRGSNGALLTLTYLGGVRTCPHYNVMGLAKASLTLAAVGISDFRKLLEHTAANAPLRRNVTIDEVGNAAAFLCSDLASGITGEIIYVDGGFSTTGIAIR